MIKAKPCSHEADGGNYADLCCAIIEQACNDYIRHPNRRSECAKFFKDPLCEIYLSCAGIMCSGEEILKTLKNRVKEEKAS